MTQLKFYFTVSQLFLVSLIFAQIDHYDYKRAITGISDQWHKLTLPNEIFEKTNEDVSDLRIFGITPSQDTIEAAFFLQKTTDKNRVKEIPFQIINTAYNQQGHFYTLALSEKVSINQINLNFRQKNFDWEIKLEGSQNQKEWFTLLEDYRILSIQKNTTNYQFTQLDFPDARYAFFRIKINTRDEVDLTKATLTLNSLQAGHYQVYRPRYFEAKQDKKSQQTIIEADLGARLPISSIELTLDNDFDYYRPMQIQYLVDSFETEKGWRYNYKNLIRSTTLSSIEKSVFEFSPALLQKIKIRIINDNNQPLSISNLTAKGPVYEIIARFTEAADYFLVYGKAHDRIPDYDIKHFQNDRIQNTQNIELGIEQKVEKTVKAEKKPLFENKAWLWGIMMMIMLLLGWFSVKMIKNS